MRTCQLNLSRFEPIILIFEPIIQHTQAPYGPQGQLASLKLVACT
jgi:hypothetical protein